jgi:beta-glucosidase
MTSAVMRALLLALAVSSMASAQQPERPIAQGASPVAQGTSPEPRWTPSSDAPAGVLSHALEGQRHDLFIQLAQQGDIELVFFGTTEAEMWWWPDRGRAVWDREFGALKAANFGSQGTQVVSLLWRMRNGELDGFQARLIVLQAGAPRGLNTQFRDELVPRYRDLLDEIRLRQPQAKVLLFAPLPRGGDLQAQRRLASERAAVFASLVDNETVFYADIGERFFDADGAFKRETWGLDAANRGTQTAAFEIWADAMQPWIDRFVR